MNKTAILSFIIDEVALKCRNVSKNMRKRIHWMLEGKEIVLKEYDERALILNRWIKVGKYSSTVSEEEIKKGVSNYTLKTQEQFDRLMTVNNEFRCYEIEFRITEPIEIESIEYLEINKENFEVYSKSSFKIAKCLVFQELSTDQIKLILTRFKRIGRLRIYYSSLESIDLNQFKIKELFLSNVSFKEPVYLPREINKLGLENCKPLNLIKPQRVNEIGLMGFNFDLTECKELFKTLKGVKVAIVYNYLKECLSSLASTVREIEIHEFSEEEQNLEQILTQFPNLIQIDIPVPIEIADKTKMRAIEPVIIETNTKFKLKPREIQVYSENVKQLNKHPELFERVDSILIHASEFNLDLLPSEIKKLQILSDVEESLTLNRLKKERG